ncbi:hypothetical protein ACFWIB_41670 [Streptomyces sp. NPDC127051]
MQLQAFAAEGLQEASCFKGGGQRVAGLPAEFTDIDCIDIAF